MSEIRYVRLDPTGNLTCLVLSPVPAADRPRVTGALLAECEQVGYLMPAENPQAAARLQMMGGEFCGNASMATVVYLAARDGAAEKSETRLLLEVSGAEGPVACRAKRSGDGWAGSAEMPLPRRVEPLEIAGENLVAVFFPGMVHLIVPGWELSRERAERLMQEAGECLDEPAVGLLQWQEDVSGFTDRPDDTDGPDTDPVSVGEASPSDISGRMIPLVWVRESGSLVWETACGSGTAAVAAWKTAARKSSLRVSVSQPGGVLTAETLWQENRLRQIRLSGNVRIGKEQVLNI